MSKNATEFIAPLTFSSLTHHKTYVDTFARDVDYSVEHIALAKRADVFLVAPASANVIAKLAHGLADDLLTTTFLACDCPKIIAPAMNTQMYLNPIVQENLERCRHFGMHILEPAAGRLACGDVGVGKLASIEAMIDTLDYVLVGDKPLLGKRVLISGGPTQEAIDPVRFITNHSSGKMGYALAQAARNLGAEVTFVSGPTVLPDLALVETIAVTSAREMSSALKDRFAQSDIVVMAAAVADYTYPQPELHKLKKDESDLTLNLQRTEDILAYFGAHKTHQLLCGFAMETNDVMENAWHKFHEKQCDLLVVNDLNEAGAGFQGDTNKVVLIQEKGSRALELMRKVDVAYEIFQTLLMLS